MPSASPELPQPWDAFLAAVDALLPDPWILSLDGLRRQRSVRIDLGLDLADSSLRSVTIFLGRQATSTTSRSFLTMQRRFFSVLRGRSHRWRRSITCTSSTLEWPAFRNRMLSGSSSCRVASRRSGYSHLKVTTWRYPSSLETARWIGRTLLT